MINFPSLNAALPAAKFQTIPHLAFCASTTLVWAWNSFTGASMPHKELTFIALSASLVTGFINDFTTISNSLPLQTLSNSSRVGGCLFLESFHSSAGQPWHFQQLHAAASIHLTITIHGSYSPLTRHQLAQCLLPFQLHSFRFVHNLLCIGRFTPTPCCTFSLQSVLGHQESTVTSTLGNGLSMSALIGHRLETELLLQCKPFVIHFFELCPQGQSVPLQSVELLVFPHVVRGNHSASVMSCLACQQLRAHTLHYRDRSPRPRQSSPKQLVNSDSRFKAAPCLIARASNRRDSPVSDLPATRIPFLNYLDCHRSRAESRDPQITVQDTVADLMVSISTHASGSSICSTRISSRLLDLVIGLSALLLSSSDSRPLILQLFVQYKLDEHGALDCSSNWLV